MVRLILVLTLLAGVALAFLIFRPGSEYPPYRLLGVNNPVQRPEIFRRFHEYLPARAIAPSSQPRLWTRIPETLEVTYTWQDQQKSLADFLDQTHTMAFMVLRDGAIVEERYALGANPNSIMTIWSASKSYTATMIAIALHQGKIQSLDDPVEKYAHQFKGTDYGQVSIRNLLMMASGMDFSHNEGFILSDRTWMYLGIQFLGLDLDEMTARMTARTQAGQEFHYLAPDTHVLSAVVRGAWDNQKTYAQLVQEELWEPFGFGGEAFWVQNQPGEEGHALGHCCLSVRLIEFAQLGQVYLEGGSFRGQRHLPEGWTELAGRPAARFQQPSATGRYPHLGYGLQFWVPLQSDGEFLAMGTFGQNLWIDQQNHVVIAHLSASPMDGGASAEERHRVYRKIAKAAALGRPFGRADAGESDPKAMPASDDRGASSLD